LRRTLDIGIDAEYARAFAREQDRGGLAVADARSAGARAGDDCDLAL
jgi:hypothetical protein